MNENMNRACKSYLAKFREELPRWLAEYVPGGPLDVESIFTGNILYWTEAFKVDSGAPIKVLNELQVVHLFVYASSYYLHSWCERANELRGYAVIDTRDIPLGEIAPPSKFGYAPVVEKGDIEPFCKFYVYEREPGFGEEHGARRIALLEIGGDTIDLFARIFCSRPSRRAPFMIGYGDYTGKTPFGRAYKYAKVAKGDYPRMRNMGGPDDRLCYDYELVMQNMALSAGKLPRLLFAFGPRSTPWKGYVRLPSELQACWYPMEYGYVYELSDERNLMFQLINTGKIYPS